MTPREPADTQAQTATDDVSPTWRAQSALLEVLTGPDAGKKLQFEGRARIGKRSFADLVLTDPKISGLHCEIRLREVLTLRDLGSKNGVFLGGFRVREADLPSGSPFQVGDSQLRVRFTGATVEIPLRAGSSFEGIVGRSASIRALTAQLERLRGSDTTVLVEGETGTGKERVAAALHQLGRNAAGPLTVVDCGALMPSLIESALFGHERGAFTGAVNRTPGAFQQADGGTLFLDEVGELPLELQSKLLRALETRAVQRVGGQGATRVDLRVIAATHRDLALEVSRGRFREDLYYRLAVITLAVPPLRERLEDIPLLASHFLADLGADPHALLTPEVLSELQRYDWPGNVRELRNTLQRAVSLMERPSVPAAEVASDVPLLGLASSVDLSVPLRQAKQRLTDDFERAYLTALLEACGGNISEVARRSGMDRMSIHRIIERLQLRASERT